MTRKKDNCMDCIHIKVCSIYAFAVKNNDESTVKIKVNTMCEVCGSFLKKTIFKFTNDK